MAASATEAINPFTEAYGSFPPRGSGSTRFSLNKRWDQFSFVQPSKRTAAFAFVALATGCLVLVAMGGSPSAFGVHAQEAIVKVAEASEAPGAPADPASNPTPPPQIPVPAGVQISTPGHPCTVGQPVAPGTPCQIPGQPSPALSPDQAAQIAKAASDAAAAQAVKQAAEDAKREAKQKVYAEKVAAHNEKVAEEAQKKQEEAMRKAQIAEGSPKYD
eukprot:CAMPEP_0114522100 /NCGR_PEP_ID=MMETSP0109-20121206/20564_1 /TAXON_ID=29199 /ORGANISM="Chlorarachnion reptans, Strain CCCM449" /LENGTH=216 /DNA_ID=CAMNT_0001703299 /DNA_START=38 /DNA_END=688 /DNA_ORIENTATION=-